MKFNSGMVRTVGAAFMAAALALGSLPKPAAADQAAVDRNTALGIAAAIALGLTVANVTHKDAVANTVEGYTPNGGTVYGDGHVVLPNGQSYYPGNYGQSIACNNGSCDISGGSGYDNYGPNGYGNYYGNYGPNGYGNYYGNGYNGNDGGYRYPAGHNPGGGR